MHRKNHLPLKLMTVALCAFLLSLGACSDDNSTPPKEAGPKEASVDKGPGVEAGAKEAGTEASIKEAGGTGACVNATDTPLLDDAAERSAVAGKAGTCGIGCLGNADVNCARDCIKKETGLTDGCADCYGATVACATAKCLAQCVADPSSAACVACRQTNCDPTFYTCSGLQQPSTGG